MRVRIIAVVLISLTALIQTHANAQDATPTVQDAVGRPTVVAETDVTLPGRLISMSPDGS